MTRDTGATGGFSLIEVVIAITILAIGCLGMAAFTATATRGNSDSGNRTRADQLVAQKIEALESESYTAVATGSDTIDIDGVEFTRAWTVSANDPVAGVKRIDVAATWSDRGTERQISTTTLIGRF